MNHIKLIACDLDGTLLQPGQTEIAPAVFEQIRRLKEKGIYFCPASGRQYSSLRKLFAPVADDVPFLCENGAVIFDAGKVISKTVIERDTAMRLIHHILSHEDCRVLISGENISYLVTVDREYIRHVRDDIGNRIALVEKPEDIAEDIIKISLFCRKGPKKYQAEFEEAWGDTFSVVVAGETWLDMTVADKGVGVRALAEKFGISLSDVMAIGDNYNDLPILTVVGHPYIMENAVDELKDRFPNKCRRVEDTLAAL